MKILAFLARLFGLNLTTAEAQPTRPAPAPPKPEPAPVDPDPAAQPEPAAAPESDPDPEVAPAPEPDKVPSLAPVSEEVEHDVGAVIVMLEGRFDASGHLMIYRLPAADGGGTHEVAGINSKYHPEALRKLVSMAPSERAAYAATYIENYVRRGTGIIHGDLLRPGTELAVLDAAFNRGPGGSAWITQRALRALGFDVALDGRFGPATRGALLSADIEQPDAIIGALRAAREEYERVKVIPRHPAGSRDKFWQGLVNRWDKITRIAIAWNAEAAPEILPVEPEPEPEPTAPAKVIVPRENNAALNRFFGDAKPSGPNLVWFNFPVDNVRLYSRTGAHLTDRDGDGNDEHRCHEKIAGPLEAAYRELYDTLGKAEFERQGWHVYAGSFNYRRKTSGGSLSTHSWGIAIDVNPGPNGWKHYGTTFSDEALDIMEKHGFLSAGRAWGHDFMHFQFAIPYVSTGSYYDEHGLPAHIVEA